MKNRDVQDNFWVSYADLATGLMIVFMVVMLLMVIISKFETEQKQAEAVKARKAAIRQKDRLKDVVSAIQVILGAKEGLAEAINKAFHDEADISADPITAQLVLLESKLRFERESSEISLDGKIFLNDFTPRYVCALYVQDHAHRERRLKRAVRPGGSQTPNQTAASEPYLDPASVNGVRRILVAGHADMVGTLARNHELSAARAEAVVARMLSVLDCAVHNALKTVDADRPKRCRAANGSWRRANGAGDKLLVLARLPDACTQASTPLAVFDYARDRLLAIGAGDTDHSRAQFQRGARPHGFKVGFDSIGGQRKGAPFDDTRYRKVSLGLELTGDDMTSLLLNVRLLQRELDNGENQTTKPTPLQSMVRSVAASCWENPSQYHGCHTYIEYCGGADTDREVCHDYKAAVAANPVLRKRVSTTPSTTSRTMTP